MLEKIEYEDLSNNIYLLIDLKSKQTKYIKNEKAFQFKLNTNYEEVCNLLKKYVIYWQHNYYKSNLIDGLKSNILIYYNDKVEHYSFNNACPINYNSFITELKGLVNINE